MILLYMAKMWRGKEQERIQDKKSCKANEVIYWNKIIETEWADENNHVIIIWGGTTK